MEKRKSPNALGNIVQLPEQIAQHLAEKIIHLEIKSGERILEAKIAQEFGVSRSPVREALHILNKQFLVDFLPRRGAVVSSFSIKFIEDLYDVLNVLYVLLARKGLSHISEENLNLVTPILESMSECADKSDFEGYYNGMFEFTSICISIVDNPILERLILNLWPSKRRMEFATLYRRKDSLRVNLDFFLKGTTSYMEGRLDLVEKYIGDYIQQEKENAILLAKEFDLN
jgi:GntR family transcriptional regulator, rspAB operon transcriptional repressor